jgi:hypothetical protein
MKLHPCYVLCMGMHRGWWLFIRTGCEVDA